MDKTNPDYIYTKTFITVEAWADMHGLTLTEANNLLRKIKAVKLRASKLKELVNIEDTNKSMLEYYNIRRKNQAEGRRKRSISMKKRKEI
jgi:hypothetical protein